MLCPSLFKMLNAEARKAEGYRPKAKGGKFNELTLCIDQCFILNFFPIAYSLKPIAFFALSYSL
jgi:hypothetical protein